MITGIRHRDAGKTITSVADGARDPALYRSSADYDDDAVEIRRDYRATCTGFR